MLQVLRSLHVSWCLGRMDPEMCTPCDFWVLIHGDDALMIFRASRAALQLGWCASSDSEDKSLNKRAVGALIIRTGFWGPLSYN